MPWGLAIAAVGAGAEIYGANKSAKAAQKGGQASIDEQRREYDQTRTDNKPWLDAGTNALAKQNAFLNGDFSGFQNSPDYKFAVEQGFKGLDRGQAASLGFNSGGADADRIALGQGLATQYANNYWAKLAGMSNTGQNTAQQLGVFGQNAANQIGGAYRQMGSARASAYGQQADALNHGLNQFNQYAQYKGWY